jgi:hypothetical protein
MSVVRRIAKPAAPAPVEEEFVDASESQLEMADAASESAASNAPPSLEEVMAAIDAMADQLKALKSLAKAAIKGAKKRKTKEQKEAEAAKPKREQSEASKAWNAYVDEVYAELKGADSSVKRSQAMVIAKERREAGLSPLPSTAQLKAEKEAEKAAKKAEREAKKAAKAPAKAVKAAAVPKPAPASAAAAAATKAPAKPAAAPATPPKAPAKPAAAPPAPKKATPPPPPPADDEDSETLQVFKHKGKTYLRSSQNECWLQGPGGSMGAWQGIYNPVKDAIVPAPEPQFDE